MGFMPGIFSRDKYFTRLDVLLNRHPKDCLQALRRIESGADPDRSVYEVAVDVDRALVPDDQEQDPNGRLIDATAIERVRAFWYGDDASFYFDIDLAKYPAAIRRRISRRTFIRALELANGQREIRTHYCCVGSHFEGVVNGMDPKDSLIQVVLVTGALRSDLQPPSLPFEHFEDVWITGLDERIQLTLSRTPVPPSAIKIHTIWKTDTDIVYADTGKTLGTIRLRRES